jgi:Putative adhesin
VTATIVACSPSCAISARDERGIEVTSILPASGALRMTPARVLTLAIGVPVILALIGWTGFSFVSQAARASFPISYVMGVQQGQLTVGVNSADITVRQDDDSTARLAGTVHYGLFRPRVTSSGNEVTVKCPGISDNCGLSTTLDVPRLAGLTLSSGGGNLTVPGVAQTVNLNSDGGDVSVSGVAGVATVLTSGGNLTAGDMGGTLRFTTDGGDVNGNGLAAPTLSTNSGGGNVNLVFTKIPANLNIISDGGDVNIVVPRGATAYRVSATANGGDDSVTVPTSSSSGNQITVDSGGGDISITEENN